MRPLPPALNRSAGRLLPMPGSNDERDVWGCGSVVRTATAPRRTSFPGALTCSLVWVLRGQGHYADADGSAPLTSGCCFVRRPGHAHRVLPDPGRRWVEWWLRLPRSLYAHLTACGLWSDDRRIWQPGVDGDLQDLFIAIHQQVTAGMAGDVAAVSLDLQRFVLLAQRLDAARRAAARSGLEAALDDAAAGLARVDAPAVPVQELCRRYGLGYERFRKAFRDRFGCPPLAWRNRHRLQRARSLLVTGDADLAAVARAAGYPSADHLAKQLRRATGLGPRAYRYRFGQV